MKKILFYSSISVFSIFIGSQITEAFLLVPYWKSLSADDFYSYYQQSGPMIGRFYTVLTIIAALIPVGLSIYSKLKDSGGFSLALASSFFAVLFIACFYIYFKGTNASFYQEAFSEEELKNELVVWGKWHWGRILLEITSLAFLMGALARMEEPEKG